MPQYSTETAGRFLEELTNLSRKYGLRIVTHGSATPWLEPIPSEEAWGGYIANNHDGQIENIYWVGDGPGFFDCFRGMTPFRRHLV